MCILHAGFEWATHQEMMAAGNDGGVQYWAGVHMLDDRIAATATPLTLGHAFYDIFDQMTIAERNHVARALLGMWITFPQRRNAAADFDDPAGTTITAGRDTPARSWHFHYVVAWHRARLGGDRAAHDAFARWWRLLMLAGGHSDWQVQESMPTNTCAGQMVSVVRQEGTHLSLADSLAHIFIYFACDSPKFSSPSIRVQTYIDELADLRGMRFEPCMGDLASRMVGGRTGHGGYMSIATMQVFERDQAPTAVPLQVSDDSINVSDDSINDIIAHLRSQGLDARADFFSSETSSLLRFILS